MKIKQTTIDSNHKILTSQKNSFMAFSLKNLVTVMGLDVNYLDDTKSTFETFTFKCDNNKILIHIDGIFIGIAIRHINYYNEKGDTFEVYFASEETYNLALKYVKKAINDSFKKPIEYLEII